MKLPLVSLAAACLLLVSGCSNTAAERPQPPPTTAPVTAAPVTLAVDPAPSTQAALPSPVPIPSRPEVGGTPPMPALRDIEQPAVQVVEIARGLEIPWAIAFAPDGRMFFTERPGRIMLKPESGGVKLYLDMRDVVHEGEGGLMGLALHPRFAEEPYLYVMYTTQRDGRAVNRIARIRDDNGKAGRPEVIVDGIAASQLHDGGVLEFGPDGMLYAGTGDATEPRQAQDLRSLGGKILRMTPQGKVPADNPFKNSLVYAYGFRNVTGLAWHPRTGDLWAANHGPSGEFPGLGAKDSVYIVRRGGNHGWPIVLGVSGRKDIASPVLFYPEEAVPPGGAIFYSGSRLAELNGNFLMTSLGAQHLQRVVLDGARVASIERWWPGKYGRLRAIEQGPDGSIYFSTSNRDGRAWRNHRGADFIYRVVPNER